MKIVVTGSGGQLGSELCRTLDAEVIGLDLPEFDLADRRHAVDELCRIGPEVIINTAAYTQVDRAEDEPDRCRAVNADGVAGLVEACRRLDAVLVQLSTDYVFGRLPPDAPHTPYRETDPPGPLGVYGRTKLEGERSAAEWPRHFIVRTSGLYGRGGPRSGGNFVDSILKQAKKGTGPICRHGPEGASHKLGLSPFSPLRVVDDQHCTPSYVPHVARAIRFLLGTKAYGTYHAVNRGQTTWYGFAAELIRLVGLEVELEPISTAEYGARAARPAYSVLDTGKYHALAGRPEMPSWQEALAEHVRSMPHPS